MFRRPKHSKIEVVASKEEDKTILITSGTKLTEDSRMLLF